MDLLFILLPINIVLIAAGLYGVHFKNRSGIRLVQKRLDSINQTSCEPMLKALSKFAQGDLSVQLAALEKHDPGKVPGPFRGISDKIDQLEHSQELVTEEFNNLTSTVSKRLCFIGGDAFSQGKQCGELVGQWLGGQGKVLISTGHLQSTGQMLRRKGFARILEDQYPQIKIAAILENEESPEVAHKQTLEYLKHHQDIQAVYVTEGATPYMVAKAVRDAGMAAKVHVVAMDLSEETVQAIVDGGIRATLADSTFAQGHDPVVHLFNHLSAGWLPDAPRMTIDANVVTAQNWKEFWRLGQGPLVSQEFLDRLPKPQPGPRGRTLDLTVIGCENSPYWFPIRDGALRAAKELEKFGAKVHWVVRKGQDLTTDVVAPLLDEARSRGTHGIAMIAEEPGIIPHINGLVENGIPVITFITEPSGLRAFITTVTGQSKRLLELNQGVLRGASTVSEANRHLQEALKTTVNQAEEQAEKARASQEAMNFLMTELKHLRTQADESDRGSESTMKAVEDGNQALQLAVASIQSMEEVFKRTYRLIENLSKATDEINSSIEVIRNVASQVNILAFNAAVEAARAGRTGAGFKVISEEIRHLSNQASTGTNQITSQIETIRRGVADTHELMTEGVEALAHSTKLAQTTNTTFGAIRQQSTLEKDRSAQVANHIAGMVSRSEQVLEQLESMVATSTKNAETLRSLEKDGQTLRDQFDRVYSGAQELESITEVEQTLLARFMQ